MTLEEAMFWYFTIKYKLAIENCTKLALHMLKEENPLVREQLSIVYNPHFLTEPF